MCSGSSIFILLRKCLFCKEVFSSNLSTSKTVYSDEGSGLPPVSVYSIQSFVSVTNILAKKGGISNISGGLPVILSVFFKTAPKAYKNVESFSCKLVFYYKYWYFD